MAAPWPWVGKMLCHYPLHHHSTAPCPASGDPGHPRPSPPPPPHVSAAADDAAAEQPSEADAGNASSHQDAAGTHGCPEPTLAAAVVDAVSAQCLTDTAENATEPLRAVDSGPPWASSLALAAAAAVDEAVAAGERSQECSESLRGCGL